MDTEVPVAVTRLPLLPTTGVYLRRTTAKVNPDSEIKFCIGVGEVEGSGNTHFKI